MHVRVKNEIVNSDLKNVFLKNSGKRLKPEMLYEFYETGKNFVIVDARNWYESKIVKFKNTVTLQMKNFRDGKEASNNLEKYKDKTIVTYCTGGTRCKKASAYLIENGYKDVYQLDGGIVSYTKNSPTHTG